MKKTRAIGVLVALVLALTLVGAVSAADDDPVQTVIEGTIVGVDPDTGDLYVQQDDGTIVTIHSGGSYQHPIVALLAEYFGESGDGDWLAAATEALATELDLEEGEEIVGFTPVTDENGVITGWLITVANEEGDTTDMEFTEEDEVTAISAALAGAEGLGVSLPTTGEGDAVDLFDVGDQIAAYHNDGIGFGVLVKIYAIAQESEAACEGDDDPECAVTVEQLVEMVLNGTGMGHLFAIYGKPSLLGVGHVRQALGSAISGGGDDGGDGGGDGGGNGSGVCNARSHGGNANANGQDISC